MDDRGREVVDIVVPHPDELDAPDAAPRPLDREEGGRRGANGPGAAVSAALSQVMARTASAPLDRIKYLLQTEGELQRQGRMPRLPRVAGAECPEVLTRVPADLGRRGFTCVDGWLVRLEVVTFREGWAGLWRGNSWGVLSAALTVPVQLGVAAPMNDVLMRRVFLDPAPATTSFFLASTAASLVSGFTAAALLYPLDAVRFALAADFHLGSAGPLEYPNGRDLAGRVWDGHYAATTGAGLYEQGSHRLAAFAPLYRGLGAGLVGQVGYQAGYVALFEFIGRLRGNTGFSRAAEVAIGYGITVAVTLSLYPLDLIRRRYMRAGVSLKAAADPDQFNPKAKAEPLAYRSLRSCAEHVYAVEGMKGMYRGASFVLCRAAVSTFLAFTAPRLSTGLSQHQ